MISGFDYGWSMDGLIVYHASLWARSFLLAMFLQTLKQPEATLAGVKQKNYISHNALRAHRFRSCAVSGADWNPESGFDKWRVVYRKGNSIYCKFTAVIRKIAPPLHSKGAPALSCSPLRVSRRPQCGLLGAKDHRLRFSDSRLRSIRHANCSLLHFPKD